ncbi:MAG: prepilin-type N-terminal cleavage/methylation domain-containing protein [Deltaproteobacteria bacterium]|nr:prepilin-type N-terminal cleavage/methylation domain-containing protein [Deltaproteobacteria bacterium]RLB81353.1 MAG: hypothetical protein DRH17_09400 [Deltaproteobacteria bacterium]
MIKAMDKTGDGGFTLLEMLIAITILAVGLLGMAGLQATAIKGNGFGIRNTEATALIEDKIEGYKNTPYASISAGETTESNLGSGRIFTRVNTVQDNTPATDMKTITVQVSWTDLMGTHTVSFRTVVSENG